MPSRTSRLTRRRGLVTRTGLARRKRLNPVNRERRAAELLRTYGPPERRAWVRYQRCIVCGLRGCDNAHITTDGMGRKADHTRIVPLCRRDHEELHALGRARWEARYPMLSLDAWAARAGTRLTAHVAATSPTTP